MTFNMQLAAREYMDKRFSKASQMEREKIIKDWDNKPAKSKALIDDFKLRVGDPKGKKIIDIGSGPGGIGIAFASAGADVYGIDVEEDLYEISKQYAESLGSPAKFFLYEGTTLPFDDNFFDYAVSSSVMEHVTDPVNYLSEIYRVLKPGGMFYLGFPNKFWPRETHTQLLFVTYFPTFIKKIIIKLFHRNPLEENNLHFYSYFDLQNMISQMTPQPFTIVKEEGTSQNVIKKTIRTVLEFFGISYKILLPHILVVLKK